MEITIETTTEGAFKIIAVQGRMDAVTVKKFDETAKEVLDEQPEKLLVDFSALDFISSAGLRGVLNLAKACEGRRPLGFCGLKPMVADVFKISGLNHVLKIFVQKDEALKSL